MIGRKTILLVCLLAAGCGGHVSADTGNSPYPPKEIAAATSTATAPTPAPACIGKRPRCVTNGCNTDAPVFINADCLNGNWQCAATTTPEEVCYAEDPCPFWMPIDCCLDGEHVPHTCSPGGAPVCPANATEVSPGTTCVHSVQKLPDGGLAPDAPADADGPG
jgi:hypothetical protein